MVWLVASLLYGAGLRLLEAMRLRVQDVDLDGREIVVRQAKGRKDRRTMLFVYEDGRAKWRYVTTGLENDTQIEIVPNEETSMVEPGEIVLVDNHFYISHDAQVQLVDAIPGGSLGGDR